MIRYAFVFPHRCVPFTLPLVTRGVGFARFLAAAPTSTPSISLALRFFAFSLASIET